MNLKLLKNAVLTVLLSLWGLNLAQAQFFVPAVAHETIYNNWSTNYSGDISCFSFSNMSTPTAWGDVDIYLAALGFGLGEVTVQFTKPGDPTNVVYHGNLAGLQGNYNYQDGSYLQVGAVYNAGTGNVQILVAYQWAGFKVDIFDLTTSSTDPIVYNSTINLTGSTLSFFDHRIRMDCDSKNLTRAAIVWDNPLAGCLQTIACENGNWSNILNINNTAGEMGPDIALSDVGSDQLVHYVYHDASGTVITKATMEFSTMMVSATSITPYVEDVNYLTTPLNSNLVLDTKDEDDAKNWAYTYSDQDELEVFVRLIDNNSGTPPTTVSVNTGVLGNASIYGQYKVYAPSLHYGSKGSRGDDITVAWYNTDGSYNGYIGLQMTPDGTGLISDADYLELPNAHTAVPYPNLTKTGVAFSKGDADNTANRHVYTVYYDNDNVNFGDRLHHAFHVIGLTAFKGKTKLDFGEQSTYPNPFSDVLHTAVTLEKSSKVRLELIDITGRVMAQQETVAQKGTYPMQLSGLRNVVPGTYFLRTSIDGKTVRSSSVIKK